MKEQNTSAEIQVHYIVYLLHINRMIMCVSSNRSLSETSLQHLLRSLQGSRAASRNLSSKLHKLDQDSLKQQEILYMQVKLVQTWLSALSCRRCYCTCRYRTAEEIIFLTLGFSAILGAASSKAHSPLREFAKRKTNLGNVIVP